jgi:hypothetical protein
MNATLRTCLEDLEARIEPQVEEQLWREWDDFSNDRFHNGLFTPRRGVAAPPQVDWPEVSINAGLADMEMMALQQYHMCSQQLAEGTGMLMDVRCNYGISIIPLLFGVELFVMDEDTDTLPTSYPLNDIEAIQRLVDAGRPEIRQHYMAKVLEMGAYYAEIAARYPKIGRYVQIYHPDLQGPMDIVEVVWGSSVFYSLYDRPELVKGLLEVVTETYIACMRAWTEVIPYREGGNAHWGLYHKGNIMLRDDSAMNLSLKMFDEFIRPYDQRLLDVFGGGAIHYCGKGDHYTPALAEMHNLYAIHMSQPEYNDMEAIYTHIADNGIKIVGLRRDAGEAALARGRDLHGQVHCPLN